MADRDGWARERAMLLAEIAARDREIEELKASAPSTPKVAREADDLELLSTPQSHLVLESIVADVCEVTDATADDVRGMVLAEWRTILESGRKQAFVQMLEQSPAGKAKRTWLVKELALAAQKRHLQQIDEDASTWPARNLP